MIVYCIVSSPVIEGQGALLGIRYGDKIAYSDITGTNRDGLYLDPPLLNFYVECDAPTLDLITLDDDIYVYPESIGDPLRPRLSKGIPKRFNTIDNPEFDLVPSQSEYGHYRTDRFKQEKGTGQPVWTPGDWNKAVGETVDGRSWRQIYDAEDVFLALQGQPDEEN